MTEYTVTEIARKLKVSSRTIQREIMRGNITATKVGRKFVISEPALERYFQRDSIELEERISKFCQNKKYEMVNLLQRLVALPSEADVPQSQEELAKFMKRTLENFGFRTVIYGTGESSTVHATYGYAKKGILLNCPLDTTTVGDVNRWSYPPFDGIIKNGKMFGRGTADCKSGIVAMIYAALALKEYVDENKIRVELIFDGGEHNGEYKGIKTALERGIDVESGIIGYAGDPNELGIGARGFHRYTFTIKGKAAHTGSRSNHGVNAVSKAAKFIQELEKITFGKSKHDLFWFGSRVTPAIIQGGSAINVIPDECIIKVDTRVAPDYSRKDIEAKIDEVIRAIKKRDSEFSVTSMYDSGSEGYSVRKNEKIIATVLKAVQKTTNMRPGLIAYGMSHVGNLLHKYKVPMIVKGPTGGNVHSYDEYVTIDSIPQTAEIYAKTVCYYFGIC